MSRRKTTPAGLYLKELKQSGKNKSIDIIAASKLYRGLSSSEKDYYDALAKKINEKNSIENKGFTTQKDTIGSNLKEVTDCQTRYTKWEKDMLNIIKNLSSKDNVMERQFVAVQVCGVYFSRADDCQAGYATSEVSFIKFNFKSGIQDTLNIFPECLKVAIGYREGLYEDLEETVGWRPDTFKNNHSLEDCSIKIREFFGGIYDPIFVASKSQQEEVGMSLFNIYTEISQRCPWLYSLQDWGQHCTIYRLDSLVSNIINKNSPIDRPDEHLSSNDVREHWFKTNMNVASECCERHQQYGLPNQCPHDMVVKNLYSSFLLMYSLFKDRMKNIRDLVSEDFYNNLDFILKSEVPENTSNKIEYQNQTSHYWNNYVFNKSGIEDVINRLEAISVNDSNRRVVPDRPIVIGRGRGVMKSSDKNVAPGEGSTIRKLKLPKVIC